VVRACALLFVLACAPALAADSAAHRAAKSAGGLPDKAAEGIERGAKATGKAAERPRAATQGFFERSGKKIDKATGGR
jgi:hypothetical protein